MSDGALPKGYEFKDVEARWAARWSDPAAFRADPESGKPPYSIVIPPPNVTGQLHMGHALNNTLQDILCRWKRLTGHEVLWLPGCDHAGIATQNVVERQLAQEGKSRHDVGREAFIARVWEWRAKYGGIIINQLKRLGASCDWSRERFTMDEGLSRAVRKVFVDLYRKGLIYRGRRMINWCPRCFTALANIEVEGEELNAQLYYIRYPLVTGNGSVVVATTRPETMLGDTAVAVHPEDPRYEEMVGKRVLLPIANREIPVIADTYVDRAFGTGCLKITPAHDFNDFEIGKRHGLDVIQVIGEDGAMNLDAGVYRGMDRLEARKAITRELEKGGYLVKVEPYMHRVGHCYRCKAALEPMLSLQWFVVTKPLAERAMQAVRDGATVISPAKWETDYFQWLENVEDWCVSRQIWWGHRIPAWYCGPCGHVTVSEKDPDRCEKCGSEHITQETDVLDTWFSSALWPFSTLGWPEKTPELARFYPTSALVTGFDILFFWVARMMMMGLQFMEEVPFRDVYVHALVRDAQGQKMSKSKGNVIDPLVMMDRFGTDALRFTLAALAVQGRDIKLSEERIEGYRHFVNKIWNASRLVLMNLEGAEEVRDLPARPEGLAHRWILSRLQRVIRECEEALSGYHFNRYADALYQFVWREYCDWYLEMVKGDLYGKDEEKKAAARAVSARVLDEILVLLHPVMPFVTEEIREKLPHVKDDLSKAFFPVVREGLLDPAAEAAMDLLQGVTAAIRGIRGEMNVPPGAKVEVVCLCARPEERDALSAHAGLVSDLARLSRLQAGLAGEIAKPSGAASMVVTGVEVFVVLKDILDFDSEERRLGKEIGKLEKEIEGTARKLGNEDFLARAPAEVVEKEREKASRLGEKLDKLRRHHALVREIMGKA